MVDMAKLLNKENCKRLMMVYMQINWLNVNILRNGYNKHDRRFSRVYLFCKKIRV